MTEMILWIIWMVVVNPFEYLTCKIREYQDRRKIKRILAEKLDIRQISYSGGIDDPLLKNRK